MYEYSADKVAIKIHATRGTVFSAIIAHDDANTATMEIAYFNAFIASLSIHISVYFRQHCINLIINGIEINTGVIHDFLGEHTVGLFDI